MPSVFGYTLWSPVPAQTVLNPLSASGSRWSLLHEVAFYHSRIEYQPMLLERDLPLHTLHKLSNQVEKSGGMIALVSGEAGIGKTTFLNQFTNDLPDSMLVRWGACDPLTTPRVLGPFHDMAASFGTDVTNALAEDTAFATLISALLDDLQSATEPNIMVIEDAHWADNATVDLLKCIARRINFLNTLLVISYRSDEMSKANPFNMSLGDFPQARLHRFDLLPLSEKAVKFMAASEGKRAEWLYSITAGNPFYVTEYLADTSTAADDAPPSVQHAVSARINRLDEAPRNFLEDISVIPHTIDPALIGELFGETGAELLDYCVERNFLKPEKRGHFRFRHELARLGTLARVPDLRKKKLHQSIYELLATDNFQTSVDQQLFHAAGAELASDVLNLAQIAGRSAAITGSHSEAASHYATALDYIDSASDETAALIYEMWSYEAALVEITEKTIEARHKALALWRKLNRTDKIGENLRWLSRQHWYRGESEQANGYIAEAINVLENSEPSAEQAMAYSLNSQYHMLNERHDEAVHYGQKALELEKQHPSAEVRIHALCNIGSAMLNFDNRDGLTYLNESLELALEHDFHEHAARVYTNTASATVYGLDYEVAEKAVSDGIVYDTKHDLDSWTHYLIGVMSKLRMEQSRFDEAETIASGVMKMENQTLLMKLPSLLVLSRVRLRMGKSGSDELLKLAVKNASSVGEPRYMNPARVGLIEQAWHNGDDDAAHSHIVDQIEAQSIPITTWQGAPLGIWMHRYGLSPPLRKKESMPTPYQLEVDGDCEKASDAWLEKGNAYQAAVSLMHSQADSVEQSFQKAAQLLEQCGAVGTLKRLRAIAKQKGLNASLTSHRTGPRKVSRQHPLGLTAREQQILPFIVDGCSNKEISDALTRSQRTIENHVASIHRKLNVNNRMEAMLRCKNEPWLLGEPDLSACEGDSTGEIMLGS